MLILHQLEQTKAIRDEFMLNGCHVYSKGKKFPLDERGKKRLITSSRPEDKTVNHVVSDGVLTPSFEPYIVYDNSSSQIGKGTEFHRKRFVEKLWQSYLEYGTNHFYIGLMDYSGYYANIIHDVLREEIYPLIEKGPNSRVEKDIVYREIESLLASFSVDVSRFSDEEIEALMHSKVDSFINVGVDPALLTGKKMLHKGCDIGAQPSQNFGIIFPRKVDVYASAVLGFKAGAYTDDRYIIGRTWEEVAQGLERLIAESEKLGLIVNRRKTRICDVSKPFRYMKVQYWVTDSGKVVKKIHPDSVTRERKKLKAYRRKLDAGRIPYETIEQAFKSWIGSNYKTMSMQQIKNMSRLYTELFGRKIKWKKGHSRLNYLMAAG